MKYFNIGLTNDISVIGYYPQTERTQKRGYHIDNFKSELNVHPDLFPDFEPIYGLDLHPNSKQTDLIDKASLDFGFVVSEKLKLILEMFKLPPHKFYRIDVFGANIQYYWLHYITKIDKYLDMKNTEIEIYNNRPPFIVQEVKIFNSYNEMIEFKKNLPYNLAVRYKKITLKSEFPNYDLFEVTGIQYFTLISQKLKNELFHQDISGLEIIEFNKLFLANQMFLNGYK